MYLLETVYFGFQVVRLIRMCTVCTHYNATFGVHDIRRMIYIIVYPPGGTTASDQYIIQPYENPSEEPKLNDTSTALSMFASYERQFYKFLPDHKSVSFQFKPDIPTQIINQNKLPHAVQQNTYTSIIFLTDTLWINGSIWTLHFCTAIFRVPEHSRVLLKIKY